MVSYFMTQNARISSRQQTLCKEGQRMQLDSERLPPVTSTVNTPSSPTHQSALCRKKGANPLPHSKLCNLMLEKPFLSKSIQGPKCDPMSRHILVQLLHTQDGGKKCTYRTGSGDSGPLKVQVVSMSGAWSPWALTPFNLISCDLDHESASSSLQPQSSPRRPYAFPISRTLFLDGNLFVETFFFSGFLQGALLSRSEATFLYVP